MGKFDFEGILGDTFWELISNHKIKYVLNIRANVTLFFGSSIKQWYGEI